MAQPRFSNRLVDETSPYLLQHCHNPVDWFSWGEEALKKSRQEDKPILLSIGYSACHWCHVMEHESFEDEDTARLMNEHFVCIKVDREERPDLDKIYQVAHQMLTQRPGGWPLTLFLTPDRHIPIFAGTYFPKTPRHGMPGFSDILHRIADFYKNQRQEIDGHVQAIETAFANLSTTQHTTELKLDETVLVQARDQLLQQYDPVNGGFGAAPKFPHPSNLVHCLRHWARQKIKHEDDREILQVALHTLLAMAEGGLFDQIVGGFYRYSVDEKWQIPHFEKMLYDNAQLLPLYVDACLATSEDRFRQIANKTADWVMAEMQSDQGGYYSTLDADSEGQEGKFYVWDADEIRDTLDKTEWQVMAARFGLTGPANFEGNWHLNIQSDIETVAKQCDIGREETEELLSSALKKLRTIRDHRIRPGRDEKILTSWNAMMITSMAYAGRMLDRPDLTLSAERALNFVRATLWKDGRLLATTRNGKAHLNAYLDDYVFLIESILELLQNRWLSKDLEFALELAEFVLTRFEDKEQGGFFFTSNDHEALIHRHKPAGDDATPSGNGVAAFVFLRLGHLLGEQRYLDAAERTLHALGQSMQQYPAAHGALMRAQDEYLRPTQSIVLRGPKDELTAWMPASRTGLAPRRMVYAIPDSVASLPDQLAERKSLGKVTAYICEGFQCQSPMTALAEYEEQMTRTSARAAAT